MFFRNLTIFAFPTGTKLCELVGGMAECQLKPVGPLELSSRGFISPFGRDSDELTRTIGAATWLTVGGEDRILPAAVINEALAKKLAEIEQAEGRKPGGHTRKRLKDEIIVDLIPRAFVMPSRIDAYLDTRRGLVFVDTSSRKQAETFVSEIRRALGSFPALPLNAEVAPRAILTGWLAGEPMPDGLTIGDECELRDPTEHGAVIKCSRQELQGDEVAKHLESGKQCTRLALVHKDHVSFVIGEDLVVRKFKLLDYAVDALDDAEYGDLRAELDARFALMTGEIGELYDLLAKTFKFSDVGAADRADPEPGAPPPASPASPISGLERVTISSASSSVTLTGAQFANATANLGEFEKAVSIVKASGNASISALQRKMKIGYNSAARLIEAMEAAGIVSRQSSTGERTVLAKEPA